ncbi:MAG TPA: ATP-binding cassette domain-containing protein [Vicinamibacterales bacterium]|nr:ATP-binding cassette domain-containing protein [Vicinamibacterales bacterium]
MPLITLEHVHVAFGHLPLLDDVALAIDARERIAVLGRNGEGKSTLLKVLSGELEPDRGAVWFEPGARVARLAQDADALPASSQATVFEAVADGLGPIRNLVNAYHHAAARMGHDASDEAIAELGRLQHELEERDGWRLEQRIETVLTKLSLDSDARVATLSGGWRRRVALAQALVSEPTLLLLDEPTNHLDLEAIVWLEEFLESYVGAVVIVTHDRAFLQRVAKRIIELDRGRLTSWPGDYRTFLEKKEAWLANEAQANDIFDKKLAQEEVWLRRGVKARRTRDEGRVRRLMAMREERAARRTQAGAVRLDLGAVDRSGHVVFEAEHLAKSFGSRAILRDFSTRVMRGDRIGLVGPNGAGKTTLLRMLVGELPPDSGTVEQGTNVEVAYFDQQRAALDPEKTVVATVGDGNDRVTVGGRTRHVFGYLEDFLFPPERAQAKVKMLSGGERNRLLLARLLTQPANVLVLDEPTNDLDLETLSVLESELMDFPGTILVVSHDRVFLENVVTSTWLFEGEGRVQEYVGTDFDRSTQRSRPPAREPAVPERPAAPVAPAGPARKKLSFNEQRELAALPAKLEALEVESRALKERIAGPEFYKEGAEAIRMALAREQDVTGEIEALYARWQELEARS